jgi:hypothetical protein
MSGTITQSAIAEAIQAAKAQEKFSALVERKCIDTINQIMQCFEVRRAWFWNDKYLYSEQEEYEHDSFSLLGNINVSDGVVTYCIDGGYIELLSHAGVRNDLATNFPIEWLFLEVKEVSRLLDEGRQAAILQKQQQKLVIAQRRLSNKQARQKAKESAIAKLTSEEIRLLRL